MCKDNDKMKQKCKDRRELLIVVNQLYTCSSPTDTSLTESCQSELMHQVGELPVTDSSQSLGVPRGGFFYYLIWWAVFI